MRVAIVALSFVLASIVAAARLSAAPDVKPLDKAMAAKIITSAGYGDVVVVAVIQGAAIGRGGSLAVGENGCTVLGIGRLEGKVKEIQEIFFYDTDLGWFFYRYDEKTGDERFRVWTAS